MYDIPLPGFWRGLCVLAVIPMDILVVTVDDATLDLGWIYTEFVTVCVLGL